jgi:tetratricopeptide (TPR) repeat protein
MIQFFLLHGWRGKWRRLTRCDTYRRGWRRASRTTLNRKLRSFARQRRSARDWPTGSLTLGEAYREKRDYGAAIVPLKGPLKPNPDLSVVHLFPGYVLLAQGYAAEAIPHLDPVGAQEALGIAQIETAQLPQAEKEYLKALRLRPDLPDLHLELGQVYANSPRWPKAEAEFRAEAKLQPFEAEAAYS